MSRRPKNPTMLILAVPACLATAAAGQDLDWAIRNVDIEDLGTELDLRIAFHLDSANLPEAIPFETPISIMLNGLPLDPDHNAVVTGLSPALPCPPAQGTVCAQPGGPCQVLSYMYKNGPVQNINGACLFNFQASQCQCVTGPPPVFHKIVPKPETPGTIEIIIDPFNTTPETNESNNSTFVPFDPDFGCKWYEDFDDYDPGGLHGQGGWKGWDDDPAFDAPVTTDRSRSGDQSVDIKLDADMLHHFCAGNSGLWSYSAWQYIPSDFASGSGDQFAGSWFLLLNTYADGGPYNWSAQYQFDSNDGMLKVYDGTVNFAQSVPYATDRWVKIQTIIDLDEDWTRIYYDDQLVTEYSWTGGVFGGGGGALDLAAVDLYAFDSSSIYYDDLTLEPILGCGETRESDADGDGLSKLDEFLGGTDSCLADSDEDGQLDGEDPCPTDPLDLCLEPCPGDLDGSGDVGINDFLGLLAAWGPNPGHPADLDGDGAVGILDFLDLLAAWGPC